MNIKLAKQDLPPNRPNAGREFCKFPKTPPVKGLFACDWS